MSSRFVLRGVSVALAVTLMASLALFWPALPASATAQGTSLAVNFAPGSSVLNAKARESLLTALPSLQKALTVRVSAESLGPKPSKALLALAVARTQAVADYLARVGLVAALDVKTPRSGGSAKSPAHINSVQLTYTPAGGLLWSEDFVGKAGQSPNSESWSALLGDGSTQLGLPSFGTGEIELNDASAATQNGQGLLAINTKYSNLNWTSARIWTAQKLAFQYGKLEIRAKFPVGSFNWPAIWMLGANYAPPNRAFGTTQWPGSGEIDIAEGLGHNSVIQSTIHGLDPVTNADWLGGAGVTATAPISNFSDDFHTWGMLWKPNQIQFSLDGKVFVQDSFDGSRVTQTLANGQVRVFDSGGSWPFNQPFVLIINNAIPSGTMPGSWVSSEFLIDYIHYSKLDGYGQQVRY